MRKLLPIMPLLLGLATFGCASDTTGASLRNNFDAGVAAYDAGDYPKAYKIWSAIDDDDIAAMRNVAMMRRQGLGTSKDPKGQRICICGPPRRACPPPRPISPTC